MSQQYFLFDFLFGIWFSIWVNIIVWKIQCCICFQGNIWLPAFWSLFDFCLYFLNKMVQSWNKLPALCLALPVPPTTCAPQSMALYDHQPVTNQMHAIGYQLTRSHTLYITLVWASTTSIISPTKVTWHHVMHEYVGSRALTWLISLSSNRKVSEEAVAACIMADVTGNTDWFCPALRVCHTPTTCTCTYRARNQLDV